jgi:hypothetical protein
LPRKRANSRNLPPHLKKLKDLSGNYPKQFPEGEDFVQSR